MVVVQEETSTRMRRKEETENDIRLKVQQPLLAIDASNADTLMEEFDRFEQEMTRNRIKTWEGWYTYLTHALDADSKKWLEGRYQTEPGISLFRNAHAPGAPDFRWQFLFAFARGILFERQGVHNQTPGEMAARAWEGIHFPKECSYDDVERVLNRLNAARIRMVKTGRFDGSAASI